VLELLRRKTPARVGRRDYTLGSRLVDAGLRVSEACGLTWGDVEHVDGVLHVRGQLGPLKAGEPPRIVPPKSSRGYRTMRLLPRLQAALEALYAGEDDAAFVLRTRRGTPLTRQNAARAIRLAGAVAGLGENVTPHVLRRTLGPRSRKRASPSRRLRRSWVTRSRSTTAPT
jgi:integrase